MKKDKIVHLLLLVLISILLSSAIYVQVSFSQTNFEQIIFALRQGSGGSDSEIFIISFLKIFANFVIIMVILYILFYDITLGKKTLCTKKGYQLYPIKIFDRFKKVFTVLLFIITLFVVVNCIGIPEYIVNSSKSSSFIEDNYVDPKYVNVSFSEKRNLIFILVESLETSFYTKDQGGYWNYELIPELYQLQNDDDSVYFYNKSMVEQSYMIRGSSWTTSSVVSSLSGVPLKVNIKDKTYDDTHFLNNVYSLGDLLKDNGYHNELISAARTSFGGIKEYYKNHGDYGIIDEESLNKYGFYPSKNDYGKWGINDKYMFEISKERLKKLSKGNEPFNLQLITIDTHFINGYVGDYSVNNYKKQYENAYATDSKLIYDFVKWVKSQDFYKDTVIVIAGDHLSMQSNIFKGKYVDERYVYNCIINSNIDNVRNSNRIITALDYYPTIIASIGGNIENNKLGLGVNLFSNEKTLSEKYGFNYVYKELNKKSDFYTDKILK